MKNSLKESSSFQLKFNWFNSKLKKKKKWNKIGEPEIPNDALAKLLKFNEKQKKQIWFTTSLLLFSFSLLLCCISYVNLAESRSLFFIASARRKMEQKNARECRSMRTNRKKTMPEKKRKSRGSFFIFKFRLEAKRCTEMSDTQIEQTKRQNAYCALRINKVYLCVPSQCIYILVLLSLPLLLCARFNNERK